VRYGLVCERDPELSSPCAGHGSMAISARYVHPDENAALDALSRLKAPQRLAEQTDSSQSKILTS